MIQVNSAIGAFASPYLVYALSSFLCLPWSSVHLPFVSFLPSSGLHFFLSTVPTQQVGYFWLLFPPHPISYAHSPLLINPFTSINLLFDLLYCDTPTFALALDLKLTPIHCILLSSVLLFLPCSSSLRPTRPSGLSSGYPLLMHTVIPLLSDSSCTVAISLISAISLAVLAFLLF